MHTYSFFKVTSLLLVLAALAPAQRLMAQEFGSIQGIVTDATGAVVVSATITAVSSETGTTNVVNTNGSGQYVFPSMRPATYSITVAASGFDKYVQKDLLLQANQSVTRNITLQLGSASQTVTVSTDSQQVDTSTGTLSQVIDTRRVNDLPLNGRNAAQLTTLVAGAVLAPNNGSDQGQTKTFPVAVTVSLNGSSADQTGYMLDGGNNIDSYTNVNAPFPFPDALREFSVETANYDAQYGQNAGGVVNIVTKSGTHAFHGDLFEYVRNRVFNARNYFASSVDPLKRNQFGGTLGGPLIIPHLISGQHTFFFVGDQKTILRNHAGDKSSFVPTQANLNGDFSALLSASNPANPLGQAIQIVNPFTGKQYANNFIDPSTFDPAAVAFVKDLPSVTGNGLVFYQNPIKQDFNEVVVRGDHDLGQTDHIVARYYLNHFTNAGVLNTSNLLTYSDQANIRVQNALLAETHSFTTNLLNNVTANYTREVSIRGPLPGAPNAASFGVNIWQPVQKSIQTLNVSGFFSVGDNPQATFQRNNYAFTEDLHWVKGNHSLAFGAHGETAKIDINSLFNQPGLFTFNSNTTNYALASFMLGYMSQFGQGSGQYFNNRNQFYGFYAQDNWRLTRKLTLNYGVRYEPFWEWRELKHRTERFSPEAYAAGTVSRVYTNAPRGLLFVGDPGVTEYSGVKPVYTNFMPRVGFAYDVYGNGKMSVRGGFGVFYDTRQPGIMGGSVANSTPFSVAVTLTQPKGAFSNPYAGTANPFPTPSPAPADLVFPSPVQAFTYDPHGDYQVPVTYAWNTTIEQQFSNSTAMRLAYVGSHMSHALTSIELNPATYIPGSTLGTDARRLYQGYSNIVDTDMGASGTYHSLQATLQRRLTRGLEATANYTWSKALNDIPYGSGLTGGSTNQSYVFPIYTPSYKRLDRGPADFDRRSVFTGSYVWTIPKMGEGNMLLRAVANGWQTMGIFQAFTGQPITLTAGKDASLTGLNQDRALYNGINAYGGMACSATAPHCVNYLNPAAFSVPANGSFGNVVKGSFRGPGYFDWDASLQRSFPLKGESNVQFRAEYFNLLNRTNLLNPTTSRSSGGFGSITSANDPRIAQLSLKLAF